MQNATKRCDLESLEVCTLNGQLPRVTVVRLGTPAGALSGQQNIRQGKAKLTKLALEDLRGHVSIAAGLACHLVPAWGNGVLFLPFNQCR